MKQLLKIFQVLLCTCIFNFANAQSFILYGDKTFGTTKGDGKVRILNLNNNCVLVGVSGESGISGDKTDSACYNSVIGPTADNWIVSFDSNFAINWNVSVGGSKNEFEVNSLFKTSNNEIVFSTRSNSDSSCNKSENCRGADDYWICALDSFGNKVWDKTWGSSGNETGPNVIELSSGNFIAGGSAFTGIVNEDKTAIGYGGWDYWLIKFDSSRQKIWDKCYGGVGIESVLNSNYKNFDILPLNNDAFLIGGRMNSPISGTVTSNGYSVWDVWISKIDSSGQPIWDKKFGGVNNDYLCQIISTQGGFLFIGNTDSPQGGTVSQSALGNVDVWIVKFDSVGNYLWDKRYGGSMADYGISVEPAPDGGYWISAFTNSPAGNDITEPPYGGVDYWMLKIDSVGNKLWDKRFGGPGDDYASNFVIMPDSSIYLCGQADSGTSAVKTDPGKGASDYWVVHFNYYNNSVGVQDVNGYLPLTLSPNPATDYIEIIGKLSAETEVEVYNLHGQFLLSKTLTPGTSAMLDIQALTDGMYLLKVFSEKGSIVQKFVKQ